MLYLGSIVIIFALLFNFASITNFQYVFVVSAGLLPQLIIHLESLIVSLVSILRLPYTGTIPASTPAQHELPNFVALLGLMWSKKLPIKVLTIGPIFPEPVHTIIPFSASLIFCFFLW